MESPKLSIELMIVGLVSIGVSSMLLAFCGLDFYDYDVQIYVLAIDPLIFNLWILIPTILVVFFLRCYLQKFKNQYSNMILFIACLLSAIIFIQLFTWYSDLSDATQ